MANLAWILFTFVVIAVVPVRTASKRLSRIRRSGPNVCGGANPGCCSGWQPSGADRGLCIQPICSFNCGTGLCVRPNVCYCQNGQYNPTCKQTDTDCKIRCLNGGTCKDDKCQCPEGFVGKFCENPVCGKPCLNGGKCISPNTCACLYGFAGPTCESDYRQGPCYKEIKDRTCQGQITTLMCTKELCCATVGKAWGAPCEQCPAKPEPCAKGYLPDYASRECLDIDECKAVPDVCGENGKCRNTVGSYACERCQVGYQYNDQTKRCQDVDECSDRRTNRCLNGRCENTLGSFTCVCDQGFVLTSDGSCQKPGTTPTPSPGQITDFCFKQIINNACARHLSINVTKEDCCCSILRGVGWSQRCERCPAESTDDYNALCSLIGPCKAKGDRCLNGVCDDQGTVLKCRCNAGFKLALDGQCVDLDECDQSSTVCTNGVCRNTLGSFACDCNVGYVRGPNPLTCVLPTTPTTKPRGPDVQCSREGEICGNGVCSRINGILQCSCNSGFKYIGNKCVATKCSREGETCENGVCSKINGILQCSCNSGFKYVGNKCVDRDECNEERGNICRDGRCVNIHGSFECDCASGYKQSTDKKQCLDVNECVDSEVCKNGRCINIKGAWRCECNQGFALSRDEKTCIDIDECRSLDDVCNNGICVNTPGDYYCRCNTGYSPSTDRHMCLDTMQTECYGSFANGVCSNMLFRSLTISQCCCGMDNTARNRHAWGNPCTACPIPKTDDFKKVCVNGRGKDSSGKDIDECSNNVGSQTDLCPNARCRNTNGDYMCDCNPGYRRTADRKQCQEVDECRENPSLCHRGRCENVPGSYRCVCPKGFVFDSRTKGCEDQDECKNANQCIDGTCINNMGSFKCQCAAELTLHHSGRLCEDLRQGKCWRTVSNNICEDNVNGDVTQEVCCQTLGKAWGSPCKKCPTSGKKCREGYVYRNFTCVDNNECESFPGICRNGRCLNTIGSYRCECSEGLTLDETNSVCLDERERVCYQTVTRDKCTKPVRGHYKKNICCCSVGAAWGSPCEECPLTNTREFNELCRDKVGTLTRVNECNTFPGICANGECIDTAKDFICNCRFGFDLDETGRNCTDIDECSLTPDLCGNGTCLNVPGAFRCNCRDGFKNAPMMMEVCIDVNECDDLSHPCQGGSCINTIGSFKCQCPPGKRMDSSGLMCQDINECSENSFICANGICQNFMGGYQCACYRGFQPSNNMKTCVDSNECLEDNGGCETICRNTIGSFTCDCPPGLRLTSDARSCEDIDECTETPEICGVGNRCRNVRGGHICSCSEAYTLSEDRKSCIDIDECISNPGICVNGRCENLLGAFRCVCPEGFTLGESSLVCIDVNECDTDVETRCDKNSLCVNSLGSYSCTCKEGFEKENDNCIDINECAGDDASATCGTNAVCINIDGSYLCQCEEGYKGDGKACSDIDECSEQSLTCSNGKCMNAPGSYECECDFGYLLTADKKGCEDVDECSALAEFCHHGRCENIPGSFQCICDKGFQLNRFKNNCTDMNECTKTGMCLNGRCVNEMGRYRCECDEDFLPNPTKTACVDTRRGQCLLKKGSGSDSCRNLVSDNELRAYCCCSVGEAWNDPCEECPVNGTESYNHLCPSGAGFVTNVTTTSVLDIDECKFPRICVNGTCANTLGSYTCTCPYGYEHNPGVGVCQDIDECSRRPYICGWTGVCINRIGGYTCQCPPGEHQVGSLCVDSRLHVCYKDVQNLDNIEGSTPGSSCLTLLTPKRITRQECCCTMGTAYGHPDMCKACPIRKTDEFTAVCPIDGTKPVIVTPTRITGPGGTPFPPGGTPGVVKVEDIDECSIIPDLCMMGRCVNNYGSYTCECRRGFVSRERNTKCLDMNECILEPCVNGECKNTFGSFMCTCSKGYNVDETGLTCVDQNECHLNGTCANGKCTNLVGDYRCSCDRGFIPARNGKACVDVNECLSRSDICRNGTCVNEIGSYSCRCNEGYREDFRHVCQDIDECTEQPNQVCRNGVCINTVGSFSCTCKIGYTVDDTKRNCRDINECREVSGYCQDGDCTNTIGGSRCQCSNGYKLHPAGDQCVDINECDEDPNLCEMNGDCANTPGSFYCICPNGYKLANDGRMCVDMRSRYCFDHFDSRGCSSPRIKNVTKSVCCCTKGTSWGEPCELCPQEQSANFALLCPKGIGYAVITNKVEDVNECEKNPMLCKNGRCINNDGSYRCQCFAGYVLDVTGRNCRDKDECRITGACGNGTCTNTPGSFRCDCAEGFKSGSLSPKCEDINECLETRKLCAFRCENIPGSYFCSCPRGYKLHADGRHCTDINECTAGTHNCRYVCKNFVGGFKCICPEGFRAIGRTRRCEDINECLRGGLCSNGACRNTPGGFICDCDAGYKRSLDGKSCEDLRRSLCFSQVDNGICKGSTKMMMMVTKSECCCTAGIAWGSQCVPCPRRGTREHRQLCIGAREIDECKMVPGLCPNGKCINTDGSYRCMCNPGFQLSRDGKSCRDIDECIQTPRPCQNQCINTPGSYRCTCPVGYQQGRNQRTCVDIDECANRTHNCQNTCVNTIGSYACSCPKGYRQSGSSCADINECQERANICVFGTCINQPGSHSCMCNRGYKYNAVTKTCVDLNECNVRSCQGTCVNLNGGYRCGCGSGYVRQLYWNRCIDVNECITGANKCGRTQCVNIRGGYRCSCPRGFQLDRFRMTCKDFNECSRSPCSTSGCFNIRGGFQCRCPTGFYPIGGGHCISRYGQTCYNCAGRNSGVQRPKKIVTNSGYKFGEKPKETGATPARTYQSQSYGSSQRYKSQQQKPADTYRYTYSYGSSSGGRKRRASHFVHKLRITVPRNITARHKLLQLTPALESLQKAFHYEMVRGNKDLFEIKVRKGVTFLHSKKALKKYLYKVYLRGRTDEFKMERPFEVVEEIEFSGSGVEKKPKMKGNTSTEKRGSDIIGLSEAKKFHLEISINVV